MTDERNEGPSTRRRVMIGWVLVLVVLLAGPAATAAQDATPTTSAAAATPAAWTPVPLPAPGEPADPETAARALQWVDDWFAFEGAADSESQVALVTDNYMRTVIGVETREELLAVFEEIAATGRRDIVESVGDIRVHPSGHLSVELVYLFREHFVVHLRDYLIEEDGVLKLDVVEQLPPQPPAGPRIEVELLMTDGALVPAEIRVPATEVIGLSVRNAGMERHEVSMMRLPDGYDPARLATEEAPPDAESLAGIPGLGSGQDDTQYWVGLEPGVYTLLCRFTGPDEIEHIATGEIARLIIE